MGINKVFLKEHEKMSDLPTTLYLVRHGELVTSKEWRYVGQMDVDLNDTGKQQFEKLSSRLLNEKIDIVLQSGVLWVSPAADITDKVLGRLQELFATGK